MTKKISNTFTSWVEISQQAIIHNLKLFRKIIGQNVKLMPIIKSNAYGHGFDLVAKLCAQKGADWLGVVNAQEALQIRKLGIKLPVLVLSYYADNEIEAAIKNNIDLVVYDFEQVKKISLRVGEFTSWRVNPSASSGSATGGKANVHIKVDTGTSRLGIKSNEALNFILKVASFPNINIRGIFTHCADSENASSDFMNQQTAILADLALKLKKRGLKIPQVHAACSAAALRNKSSHLTMIRLGISLYGLWPSEEIRDHIKKIHPGYQLEPALTWKTKIIQIKQIGQNETIGYNKTFRAKRKMKIAVIPVGYNEGFPRLLSNPPLIGKKYGSGEVLIRGQRAPVVGRVCMNLTMIDISKIPSARVGDEVVIIGKQGRDEITSEEMAQKCATINYEVVTRINPILPRVLS